MEYKLLTLWRVAAPRQQVFEVVFDSLNWPSWWPGAEHVEQLDPGDAAGIGSIRRYVWKSRMPYRLSFAARTTRIEKPHLLEAEVEGDLIGVGRWCFADDDGITAVRYEWRVRTARLWMNTLEPLAKGVFVHNHHAIMRQGGEGLARRLDACLVGAFYGELIDMPGNREDC